jgi:ATP-dependent Clp protease adaptor protein ClpS
MRRRDPKGPAANAAKPDADAETKQSVKRLPPYNVILLNDDFHSFDFVVMVLRKVYGVTLERGLQLALMAHETGRTVVWTGPKEVAELRLEQMQTFREVRDKEPGDLGPVDCLIEPAPGG